MRLIDVDVVVEALDEALKEQTYAMDALRKQLLVGFTKQVLSDAPTVDAVPVIRCEDCKFFEGENEYGNPYCSNWSSITYAYGFCHEAKRRKENKNELEK